MILDLGPLRRHRNFRLLFLGQMVSMLGSMVSYVAVPQQVFELTHSQRMVGMIGAAQLVPVLIFGLWGGSVADALDRRRLLLVAEAIMGLGALLLTLNARLEKPSVAAIFAISALMQAANAFHRPAMEALNQKLVLPEEMAAASALGALRGSGGAIVGPAFGGLLIAWGGSSAGYIFDTVTFAVACASIWAMRDLPPLERSAAPGWGSIVEGLRYAFKRPELIGTYVVDIVAMTFAFPVALYPAMAEAWGGAAAAGQLYSAISIGALAIAVFSRWTGGVKRQGAAVVIAAGLWGVCIVGFGLSRSLYGAIAWLALAGAADAVSGIFRMTIWNQTIPNEMRGRLAGAEMISYLSGPLLGNARAGWVAEATSNATSVVSGGLICVVGVLLCAVTLRGFWRYTPAEAEPPHEAVASGAS
jgi:hypothetical protein